MHSNCKQMVQMVQMVQSGQRGQNIVNMNKCAILFNFLKQTHFHTHVYMCAYVHVERYMWERLKAIEKIICLFVSLYVKKCWKFHLKYKIFPLKMLSQQRVQLQGVMKLHKSILPLLMRLVVVPRCFQIVQVCNRIDKIKGWNWNYTWQNTKRRRDNAIWKKIFRILWSL